MRGRLRWLAIAAGVLALLVGAAWATVAVLLPPERVREIVASRLSATLQREVRFADAGVSLFPPVRLTLRDLALASEGGFDAGRDFELRHLHLDLDVFALLARRVVVRRLVLDGPRLRYLIRADGTTNFDNLMREEPVTGGAGTADPGMSLEIQDLVVKNGGLLLDDLRADRRVVLTLDSELSLRHAGEDLAVDGHSSVTDVALGPAGATRERGLRTGLAPVRWEIGHRGRWRGGSGQLELERLTLQFGRAEIACRGVVAPDAAAPRYKLQARAEAVELQEILHVLSEAQVGALAGLEGSGTFACDLRIESASVAGALPIVIGTATVEDADVQYRGAPASIRDLGARLRFAPDTLEVVDLRAAVEAESGPPTPVQARLVATRLADPLVRFALQGTVNLEAVTPLVAAQGGAASGRAEFDVRGAGPARDPSALHLDGRVVLHDVAVERPDAPRRLEAVNGSIAFSTSRAEVRDLTLSAGESRLSLDATLDQPLRLLGPAGAGPPAGVRFALASPHFDINDFVSPTAQKAPLPNVAGEGTVAIDRFLRDRLDARAVRARVIVQPTSVVVPEFSLEAYGGTTRGSAAFDYREPERPSFAIDAQAAALDADQVLSTWTPLKGWVSGTLGTELELSGAGKTPQEVVPTLTALGLASLAEASLGPGPVFEAIARTTGIPEFKAPRLDEGYVPFAIENGRFLMRDVTWNGPTGAWTLGGSLGFGGDMDLGVHIMLPPEAVARLGAAGKVAAEALRDDAGRMLLDLRVTGPAQSPRVAWDAAATRARLEARARDALDATRKEAQEAALEALRESLTGSPDTASRTLTGRGQSLLDSLKAKGPASLLRGLVPGPPADTGGSR